MWHLIGTCNVTWHQTTWSWTTWFTFHVGTLIMIKKIILWTFPGIQYTGTVVFSLARCMYVRIILYSYMFLNEIRTLEHWPSYATTTTSYSHTKKGLPHSIESATERLRYASPFSCEGIMPATVTHLLLLLNGCSFFSLFTESWIHWCCSWSLRLGLIRMRWSGVGLGGLEELSRFTTCVCRQGEGSGVRMRGVKKRARGGEGEMKRMRLEIVWVEGKWRRRREISGAGARERKRVEVGKGGWRRCGMRDKSVSIGTGKRGWSQEKDRPHSSEKGDRITHNVTKTYTALNLHVRIRVRRYVV